MCKGPGQTRNDQWLVGFFCFIAVVLGAYQAWDTRHAMNADGISYLDMGEAYLRGDWDMAINAYWSPFYSWLLGLAMHILRPSAYWEFPVVHLVNYLIFLNTLLCFHFFLLEWIKYNRYRLKILSESGYTGCPKGVLIIIGYSLFIWSSLNFITISIVTPDMCVAAFVFLASGIILRIRRGNIDWNTFIMLGVVLGFSYLAKAIMFPLSFIFLLISLFLVHNFRKALPRFFVALMTFLIVAGPFIAALSISKGRFTYGDSGKLNYVWYVNNVTRWVHWQGEPTGSGFPEHPVRKIFSNPPTYEFGTPRGGTYPAWYDPSYWYEGVQAHFDLSKQLIVLKTQMKEYADILFKVQPALLIGCIILYYMSRRRWLCIKDMADQWSLIIPSVAVMVIYAMVHVERRFLGAFIVLLWTGVFYGVKLPKSEASKSLMSCIAVFMAMMLMIGTVYSPLLNAYQLINSTKRPSAPDVSLQVVEALARMGISRGDKIAVVGWTENIIWARLARVQIVADIPSEEKKTFLEGDHSVKSQVFQAISKTGAKIIIINAAQDCYNMSEEWKRIGETEYYLYNLS